ncbi:MAG: type IV conjugative transfer system protein TraL [Asticcacaulis sp. 32-58-5]|jgi:conjugal transfer pilus assembly protein TraL|uniref:type IV conjugative transfer system protein TraL n=1 Tax=Asticcacaulis sp. AND118 TaxID=2840468 RepID=UPI000BDAB714|nr:type IV conjugative transfer system protein TraL [Asticcacaulis sp. AND118]OYW83531.1 MAG: type IV conjugative transfer system protein TraL [Asticcacaulis sp. 32-58-5]UDF05768.1 type IV conjugative transfer system protein TraL [Asticcacaulis sp. AND118]
MDTRIPQYLDEPERYFVFTPDELVVVVVPLGILTIIANFLIGLIVAFGAFWLFRRLKKGGSLTRLLWLMFWLLPFEVLGLKKTPPAQHRLMVG